MNAIPSHSSQTTAAAYPLTSHLTATPNVKPAKPAKPGWPDTAYRFLHDYCLTHRYFISEEVSAASRQQPIPQPDSDRAWGPIYLRAVRKGLIAQDGIGRSARRHGSICPLWKSLVARGLV